MKMSDRGNYFVAIFTAAMLAAVLSSVSGQGTPANLCPPGTGAFYYGHPTNCSLFYICAFGNPYLYGCPEGLHFSDPEQGCVEAYSGSDECAREHAQRECAAGRFGGRLGHPTDCRRYFDCADTSARPHTSRLGQYEAECPGAEVFNLDTAQCVPNDPALCGDRVSPPCQSGSCYSLTTVTNMFSGSQAECQQKGGKLAEIESQGENDFIASYLASQDLSGASYLFIGADDEAQEGVWNWQESSASFSAYTNWGNDQPNNFNKNEDCLSLSVTYNWEWYDRACHDILYGICEIAL